MVETDFVLLCWPISCALQRVIGTSSISPAITYTNCFCSLCCGFIDTQLSPIHIMSFSILFLHRLKRHMHNQNHDFILIWFTQINLLRQCGFRRRWWRRYRDHNCLELNVINSTGGRIKSWKWKLEWIDETGQLNFRLDCMRVKFIHLIKVTLCFIPLHFSECQSVGFSICALMKQPAC